MMEGQADRPSNYQLSFFCKTIRSHNKVETVTPIEEQVYRIDRTETLPAVVVYVSNLYSIGWAEFTSILSENKGINCVVTMSNWNQYTSGAKSYATDNRVGLFKFSEFMGALHWTKFWKYVR